MHALSRILINLIGNDYERKLKRCKNCPGELGSLCECFGTPYGIICIYGKCGMY